MGIGDIIANHTPSPASSAEAKSRKEHTDEIVKELVGDLATEAPKKKGPGRPRKNSDPGQQARPQTPPPPKSPTPKKRVTPGPDILGKQEAAENVSAQQAANEIENHAVIRQLSLYVRKFPQFAPPAGFNPYLHTPDQNRQVIAAIIRAIHCEIEFLTAPALIRDGIRQSENGAMLWAVTHQDHPAAPIIASFHQASEAVLSDPAIDMDLKLLECQISDFLPTNSYARLAINVGRVLLKTFAQNSGPKIPAPHPHSSQAFDEF